MVPSHIGQNLGAGDTRALFIKLYMTEVFTAFEHATVFKDRHYVRTIPHGKAAEFPISGRKSAHYHTAGTQITGRIMKHATRTLTIDDLLIADTFLASVDELMNHYDVRSIYTTEDGRALAREFDTNVARVAINAARSPSDHPDHPGGTTITSANAATQTDALVKAAFDARVALDQKEVPSGHTGFSMFVRPVQYYMLAQSKDVLSKDYNTDNGDYSRGEVKRIAGFEIVEAVHLPSTNVTDGYKAEYNGDFRYTTALMMHQQAVGTLQLLGIQTEMEYQIAYQGTLAVSKMLLGHGILNPAYAVEVATQ